MKRIALLLCFGAAVATLYPAAAGAARFSGVVVAKQTHRHALVIASRSGAVRTVRTAKRIRVGSRVVVNARVLHDGTFAATRIGVRGRALHARIHAVVVRRVRGGKLVSAGHSVFRIRTGITTASLSDHHGDQPGDEVDETVTIAPNGELDEDNEQEVGHADLVELEGSFVSFAGGILTIKTEDGPTIGVVVPAGFTLPTFTVGESLELKVSVSGTTFTLVKVDSEDDQGDDDQGDDDGGGGDD
jgi:hypothetical protein